MHTATSLTALTRKCRVLGAPCSTAPVLNDTTTAAILVATARTLAAKALEFSDSLFRSLDVISIIAIDGESCAILLYPCLEALNDAGELIRKGFVGARLILSHPKEFVQ